MVSEFDLDKAFADKLVSSAEFCIWLLTQTKFRDHATQAVLLWEEQKLKQRKFWWRHWWCKSEDGGESETDIFAVFEVPASSLRFALHVEDKPPHGEFTLNQPLQARARAEFMKKKSQFMNYSDFTTILLAPASFIAKHKSEAKHFELCITYEAVGPMIPLFAQALTEAK